MSLRYRPNEAHRRQSCRFNFENLILIFPSVFQSLKLFFSICIFTIWNEDTKLRLINFVSFRIQPFNINTIRNYLFLIECNSWGFLSCNSSPTQRTRMTRFSFVGQNVFFFQIELIFFSSVVVAVLLLCVNMHRSYHIVCYSDAGSDDNGDIQFFFRANISLVHTSRITFRVSELLRSCIENKAEGRVKIETENCIICLRRSHYENHQIWFNQTQLPRNLANIFILWDFLRWGYHNMICESHCKILYYNRERKLHQHSIVLVCRCRSEDIDEKRCYANINGIHFAKINNSIILHVPFNIESFLFWWRFSNCRLLPTWDIWHFVLSYDT